MLKRFSIIAISMIVGSLLLLGSIKIARLDSNINADNMVIFSEVAWSGTASDTHHEWLELYNRSKAAVDLGGWTIKDQNDLDISLFGVIQANDFFLLERYEQSVSDRQANQVYAGSLSDTGEKLTLRRADGTIVDEVNPEIGSWPAGTAYPTFQSMERASRDDLSIVQSWRSNNTIIRNGLDEAHLPINGTPGMPNSSWLQDVQEPDLALHMTAPLTSTAGSPVRIVVEISNTGAISAQGVVLTNHLPENFAFVADDGVYPHTEPSPGQLSWQLGPILPMSRVTVIFSATSPYSALGQFTNWASVRTSSQESALDNNDSEWTISIISAKHPVILISAVHYSGLEYNQPDEAIELINLGGPIVDLTNWAIGDNEGETVFPTDTTFITGGKLWIARSGQAFRRQFGFEPDFEIVDTIQHVPDMSGSGPRLADDGDEILLLDSTGIIRDAVVYLAGDQGQSGWSGPAIQPYTLPGVFGGKGQILFRRKNPFDGWPIADTNSARDWAQTNLSTSIGSLVYYPGWDIDDFYFSNLITETANVAIGIAPDNALGLITESLKTAEQSIRIETLTFRSWEIATELISAADRGVDVRVLLEGDPPGGIDNQERLICQQLALAGGSCWFMISDAEARIFDRYRYLHSKFILIDQEIAIISTENMSPDSFPVAPPGDSTNGRRGLVLVTDAAGVIQQLSNVWEADFDPENHVDILQWTSADSKYGSPPAGTVPVTSTERSGYLVRFPDYWSITGTFTFELVQSPENSLRRNSGILNLLEKAGDGDTILVQELIERNHWGPSDSDSASDPNPRLEAIISAARRGASVYVLLDAYFDDENDRSGNFSTCLYLSQIANLEDLELRCQLANPTGLGIHNKMILVLLQDKGYGYIGSINGTELSHKGNREIALLIQSDELYSRLATMFFSDWRKKVYLPVIYSDYAEPASHLLISEVYYDPPGSTEDYEFIEIVNPTNFPVLLDNMSIGDASQPKDFEDVRRFPKDTVLLPKQALIIATTAVGFEKHFGFMPDFEIVDTDKSVQDLIDDPYWGDPHALLQLGNMGDELFLRDGNYLIIDALAYGSGVIPNQESCPLVSASGRSLERHPYWRDTDSCPHDFRDWPFPNPGVVSD